MDIIVEPRAPELRCYKCGSSSISALCHHCWRAGCEKHVLPSPPWARRLSGPEGDGPGLKNVSAFHCGGCSHTRTGRSAPANRWFSVAVAGAGLAAVGLVLTVWLSAVAGLIVFVAGGLVSVWACLRVRRTWARLRLTMPVPLHPKVADVEMIERIGGEITLGPHDSEYRTALEPVTGMINTTLTFGGPDRDRVLSRRKRLRAKDAHVRYCAGRLVLVGPLGIKIDDQVSGPILSLDDDTGHHAVFRPENAPSSTQWKFSRSYELQSAPKIKSGPVWITPSIVPESNRHALELDIQWVEFGPDEDNPLSLDTLEILRLEFPVSWGRVIGWGIVQEELSVQPRAVSGLAPGGRRWLELKRMSPARPDKGSSKRPATRLTLSVRFEGQVDQSEEISGRLEAVMRGTLSGVTGVRVFNSLGERKMVAGGAAIRTRLEIKFRLSLASIRYEASRVVPDRAAEDSDRDSFADEFPVIPNDETVIALTNAMSEEGFYVKHVIENPPRSGRRADFVQRYWDIVGRGYEGIYPIDFHIVLTGEEFHSGDIHPERGTTKVRIVVKGAYTDDEMETRIGDEWKRLRDLTLETLGRQTSASEPA